MNSITVNVIGGDGTAYVSDYHPSDGDTFTIYCEPLTMGELLNIEATDSHGYSIAVLITEVQSLTYNPLWGTSITIDVEFSESPWYAFLGMALKKKKKPWPT